MATLRKLLRSRLALRIYLVGLAQMGVVAVGFIALLTASRPPGGGPQEGNARFVAAALGRILDDQPALEREVIRAREEMRARVTVVDPDGVVLATSARPGTARCSPRVTGRPIENPDTGEVCQTVALTFPEGRVGHMEYVSSFRPPPVGLRTLVLVLVVVFISSWLLARSLTRPLQRLSDAARAFGGGDLGARAALKQKDELGDVSRAFDEMAARVTELLRAEKELLANVSHELRTPLARIRVALDLASEGDEAMTSQSLADIAGDLDELERLISDVLTAARLDLADASSPVGVPPLRRTRVHVHDLLTRAASRFRAAHPERVLHVDIAEDLPVVDGDAVLLRRVIDNLLENAHKYTEQASEPIALVGRRESGVVIEVIDKGIGISADDLPRVFRPFFRADKSRTRATGGLGLGLALAKRIVDAHGGSIKLMSAPNEGTRAWVQLPCADDEWSKVA